MERGDGKKGAGLKPELLSQLNVLGRDGEMPAPTSAPAPTPVQASTPPVMLAATQDDGVQAMDTT